MRAPRRRITPACMVELDCLCSQTSPGSGLIPTDRISPPSSLIETMRAMARDRASGARHSGKTHGTNPSPTESSAPANARQIGELQSRLR